MSHGRRDPEELLAQARREEERARRGRLKIFIGMSPGVGKTYAMLSAAHRMAAEGRDVVIGVAETHGRIETEQMLLGLSAIPLRTVEYRGVSLGELDLEAALARKPEVLIVDELAHTNAPSSRFEKRWQDVEELRNAGISIYTTLNIQHVESLNDVVARITGVQVRETVPDRIVEHADEIELIDLAPDALIDRLKAGKVYVPQAIGHATDAFFRKTNLTALRELVLRQTAQWVDRRMQEYRREQGVHVVWPTVERVLVCVSPSPSSPDLVRAAKRMATGMQGEMLAVFIESGGSERLAQADRERALQTLRLAESLGAQTAIIHAPSGLGQAATELVAFARTRNATKIILGKTRQSRLRSAIFGTFMDEVIRRSGEIDVHVILGNDQGGAAADSAPTSLELDAPAAAAALVGSRAWPGFLGAGAIVALAAGLSLLTYRPPDLSDEAMIFVIGVLLVAWKFGRWPAVVASVLSVLAFNYFLTEPRYSLRFNDPGYLITFVTLLATGLVVGTLTARLREQIALLRDRERRTALLYSMSRGLMEAADLHAAATLAVERLAETFNADVALLAKGDVPTTDLVLLAARGDQLPLDDHERAVARWAFDHGQAAGMGTRALPSAAARYVPLRSREGILGVLALRPRERHSLAALPQLLLLDACADQIAAAMERVALRDSRQRSEVKAERERLRSALLSSVSHDLRTPLASIEGSASALLDDEGALGPESRLALVEGIVQEAQRLNDLIGNLMFATRLEGGIEVIREWTTIEEVVGAGLARHREALAGRSFTTTIPRDLPMIRGDSVMLAQVIHNLVDNALRYTPPDAAIEISAWHTDQNVIVRVSDRGPGMKPDELAHAFERLYRGRAAQRDQKSGMGLGLTICEGVVKAHGGSIWVEANRPQGTAVLVALPYERPQPAAPPEAVEPAPSRMESA